MLKHASREIGTRVRRGKAYVPRAFPFCKSFCFVGENWIIQWADVQKPETASRAEGSSFPLLDIPLLLVLPPT